MADIHLVLTHDEALVLFEWLAREDGKQTLPIEDQAEQTVLWKLEGQLEKVLVDPLRPDYRAAVEGARLRVRGGG